MFSFHKPKIYRSLSGCCICRAKSSSSRFTDSKKYEAEFEKCFRIIEKRCGEICNACVLLVKRWKKLPTGTNRNWHHVVDARAGPGTKSFKNRSNGGVGGTNDEKKRQFGKSSTKNGKAIRLVTSSDSESEDEIEDDLMICDDLMDSIDNPNDIDILDGRSAVISSNVSSPSAASLRRSTRLAKSDHGRCRVGNGHSLDLLDTLSNRTNNNSRINAINASSKAMLRKRKLATERFFSFLDTTVWQKEKVCCGVIFKGPNNAILIYPELLNPCSCRQPQLAMTPSTPPTPTLTNSSNNSLEVSSTANLETLAKTAFISAVSLPPKLLSPNSVQLSNNNNKSLNVANVKSSDFLIPPKTLRHQDSFTNHSSSSISSDLSDGHGQDTDDQSSGVSSMVACEDSTPDSPSCLMIDPDDASSGSDVGSYDTTLNRHHHSMVVVSNTGSKTSSDAVVPSLSYSAQAVV